MSISDQFIVRSWWRKIDDTDETDTDETDDTDKADEANKIGCVKVKAASNIDGSNNNELVKPQSFVRVGGNGEWGIHGIIGSEIIDGKLHYCVDWQPTMMPFDELFGARGLVREFETREQARKQARLRRADNTRPKKYRGRKQK